MFLIPTRAPGLTMNRVRMANGSTEFCEEFFDSMVVPASAVVGEVNDGWRVVSRQLFHERSAVGGGSPFISGRGLGRTAPRSTPLDVARATGRASDPLVRELIGGWIALEHVHHQTMERVGRAITAGVLPAPAAAIPRLLHAESLEHTEDVTLRIAGAAVAGGLGADPGPGGRAGIGYLMRQGGSLGGGSTEMSRNVLSERVLGMPREPALDRDVPFNRVKRGR
jgi:alkylation response protein AidB-like acyl-CoA dehydrogenase